MVHTWGNPIGIHHNISLENFKEYITVYQTLLGKAAILLGYFSLCWIFTAGCTFVRGSTFHTMDSRLYDNVKASQD